MLKRPRFLLILSCAAATAVGLAACGGGSGTPAPTTAQARMKLSVGDAPVDGATHVVVEFTGVELTGNSGNPVTITFDQPKDIDLMTQSGTASAVLFDQPIPAGSYGQIRLMIAADGTGNNSHITLADGNQKGLRIPSGAQTGLKLVSGFTVPASGVVDYMVDFDLRKAITCPPGQDPSCILKPAMRLVNNTTVGNIQGQITSVPLPASCHPGVYLYGAAATRYEDMNSAADPADVNQPIASKVPVDNSTTPYYYQFTFLEPGTYQVAFTCQANLDTPDAEDASVLILPVARTDVSAGQTQTVDVALGSITGQIVTKSATATAVGPVTATNPLPTGCVPGVYLYPDTVTTPEDMNSAADPATNQPLTRVLPVDTDAYAYTLAEVPVGSYTMTATCAADDPDQADGIVFTSVVSPVSVVSNTTTTQDMELP